MDKQILAWLGTASGSVTLGGVIVLLLLSHLHSLTNPRLLELLHIIADINKNIAASGWTWASSLLYIIPGIIGLVAAFVQNTSMYVKTCIFASISLFVMGITIIVYAVALRNIDAKFKYISDSCFGALSICICRSGVDYLDYYFTPFKKCADLENFIHILRVILAFFILTWVAELAELVLACYYAFRRTFIIATGIVGLVAAYAQNKWMYLTTWIAAGLSIFITIYCIVQHDKADDGLIFSRDIFCRWDSYSTEDVQKSIFYDFCDLFEKLIDTNRAILAFFGLTLVAEVAELVVACYYFVRSMQPTTQPMVIVSYQQPILEPGQYMMPQDNVQARPVMMPQANVEARPIMIPQEYLQPGPVRTPQA